MAMHFISAFKACAGLGNLEEGKILHKLLKSCEMKPSTMVGNSMMNMYVNCGSVEAAQEAFDSMAECNVSSWSVMIGGYTKVGNAIEEIRLFSHMQSTYRMAMHFISAFKACAGLGNLEEGKILHKLLKSCEMKPSTMVGNSMMNMYVNCGSVEAAQEAFDSMEECNVSSWSVMIGGYTKVGNAIEEIRLFSHMQSTYR
ncbi:hypothetical protein L7F22_036168, partial [Adiantum nelumboides]|nr:hypothetical protein [Adiantum nelumboides]